MSEREGGSEHGRRGFLRGLLGVGGVALAATVPGCGETAPTVAPPPPVPPPPPPVVPAGSSVLAGKDLDALLVHGTSPPTLETRREAFGTSVLTPTSRLFVRQNLQLPPASIAADRAGWTLRVSGVREPGEIRLDALQRLGLVTVAMVLQCSGNGRRFFEHGPSGTPWAVGAAGCVMWSGVPLSRVAAHFGGVRPGARFLTATGAEPLPAGTRREDVVVERSIPIEKALQDTLLAWELNGEPLPLVHGAPLRLVVPGYYGVNQVKFVDQIAFAEAPTQARIHSTGYRLRPIGEAASPEQPSMWEMGPKSFVTHPTARTPMVAGRFPVHGVAFGGIEAVEKVELSQDGTTWTEASLVGPDLGPYAWRVFRHEVDAPVGALTLFSRVTTVGGRVQPERRLENDHGYGNDSWRDLGVVVQVCASEDEACLTPPPEERARRRREGPVELSQAGQRGRTIFAQRAQPSCTTCHALREAEATGAVGPNLDELGPSFQQVHAAVSQGVGAMPSFTQTLTPAEIEDVATYVFEATR